MNESTNILTDNTSIQELENFLSENNLNDFSRIMKKFPPATSEENLMLIKMVREGDASARELMINKNTHLVISIAFKNRAALQTYDKLDVIQDGIIGLINAIDGSYDETKGSFGNYATTIITSAIGRGICNYDKSVRRPEHFYLKKKKYNQLMENSDFDNLNDNEKCDILDINTDTLRLLERDYILTPKSIDEPLSENTDTTIGEVVSKEDDEHEDQVIDTLTQKQLLVTLRSNLLPKEYYIFYNRRVQKTMTQKELGSIFRVTDSYIQLKEARILKKVKNVLDPINSGVINIPIDTRDYKMLDELKVEPITPREIVSYLYIKDELSNVTRRVFKEIIFGRFRYNPQIIARQLNTSPEQVEESKDIIDEVLRIKTENSSLFDEFYERVISLYKGQIYRADLEQDVSFFKKNRAYTYELWRSKSYEELEREVKRKGEIVPEVLKETLKIFFMESKKISSIERTIERPINMLIFNLRNLCAVPPERLKCTLEENDYEFTETEKYSLLYVLGYLSKGEYRSLVPNPLSETRIYNDLPNRLMRIYFYKDSYRYYTGENIVARYKKIRGLNILPRETIQILDAYLLGTILNVVDLSIDLDISLENLHKKFEQAKRDLIRKYCKIYNPVINSKVDFVLDVIPYLCFFSKSDQQILIKYYRDNILLKDIALEKCIDKNKMYARFVKIRYMLCKLWEDDDDCINFDYFWCVVNEPDLPYFGNKEHAIAFFKLHYEEGLSYQEIRRKFYPDMKIDYLKMSVERLKFAVLKYREGIRIPKELLIDNIISYYEQHKSSMDTSRQTCYHEYFERYNNISLDCREIPTQIALDILKEHPNYFRVRTANKETVLEIIKRYRKRLSPNQIIFLMKYFNIEPHEVLDELEMNETLRYLAKFTNFEEEFKYDLPEKKHVITPIKD